MKLNDIPAFSTLGDSDIKEIEPYIVTGKHRKKSLIFSEGDPPGWFYIVTSGKVKITKVSHEGKEVILEIIQPKGFFGGVAVIRGFPYPANAVAMEETELIKISRGNLMTVLDRFPSVMYYLVQDFGDRLKGSHEALKNIALEKASSRIASLLLKLAGQTGTKTTDGVCISLKLTKQDIAEMVGTTVETAIRTMSQFKKLGLITEKAGKITIKDPEGLKTFS